MAILLIIGVLLTVSAVSIAQQFTFRVAYVTPEGGQYDILMNEFKRRIEERTGGEVRLVLIPGGAAGSEKELVEQLQLGSMDMTITGIPSFVEERLDLLAVPFVYKDIDHINRCSAGLVGRQMAEWMEERGVVVLDLYARLGTAVASTVPIRKADDWNGVKIRISETEPFIDFYRALGASPTPLPFGEVYTALETGVVDGVRTLLDLIYDTGFYENTSYVVVTGDPTSPAFFQVSRRSFDNLPPEIQLIFYQTAAEIRAINNEWVMGMWDTYEAKLTDAGQEFIYYDSELARDAVSELPQKYAQRYNAEELLELIYSLE